METIIKCIESLKISKSDNEKLAAIMVISKLCNKISMEEDLSVELFEAISPTFLVRMMKPNPSAPQNAFKILAISILSYFGKTNPAVLLKDTNEHDQLIKQLLNVFNTSEQSDNLPLYNDVLDILLTIVNIDVGANTLLQNNVYFILCDVMLEEDLMEKVFSLFTLLLLHCGELNEDFMKCLNYICHSFQSNQELLKFKYLKIINQLFRMVMNCKINIGYQKNNVMSILKNISMACKDILQSHVKADVKRSVITLLCTIVKLCGHEWMFDNNCVETDSNFIILLLTNLSIELAFLLQSSLTESDQECGVIESGIYIAQSLLNFICSDSFEQHPLASDNTFILKMFNSFKNIMRLVYEFLLSINDSDLSFNHPVIVSTISMLSAWATDETEYLREELKEVLPVLVKVGKKDLENVIQNNKTPTVLDIMAPFVAQTIPEEEMRKILVSNEYHNLYVMYLSHMLTAENIAVKAETFEQLCHIMHQFIILETKLCSANSNFKDLSMKIIHFVLNIPSNFTISSYSWLEIIIISLRSVRMYKMEYTDLIEELIKYSIRFVYELTDKPFEDDISDICYIAVQNIIACYSMYKQEMKSHESFFYLKGWSCKSTVTKDMKVIIDQLVNIVG